MVGRRDGQNGVMISLVRHSTEQLSFFREIVKYMVMKYGFEKEDKNNVSKADTIYEVDLFLLSHQF